VTGPLAPLPLFARGMLDDAAVFPPGLAPLPDAVAAHREHEAAWYGGLVGPLVIAGSALGELAEVLRSGGAAADGPALGSGAGDSAAGGSAPGGTAGRGPLRLALTFPGGPARVAEALEACAALPVSLEALEIAVPDGMEPGELLAALDTVIPKAARLEVFVEIPRDARRDPLLAALAGTRYRAKFRTGGVRAEFYPDEAELAAAVLAAVGAGVPFKATAGLHHALRNTDPETGFEQHGFLNLLLAADAAGRGTEEPTAARAAAARATAATQAGAEEATGAAAGATAVAQGCIDQAGAVAASATAVTQAGTEEATADRAAAARATAVTQAGAEEATGAAAGATAVTQGGTDQTGAVAASATAATQADTDRTGAAEAIIRDLLAERDGAVVAARVRELGPERIAAARARFTSFGTCSVTDPLTELAGLGLLTEPGGAA
jgi:hypothetical protein